MSEFPGAPKPITQEQSDEISKKLRTLMGELKELPSFEVHCFLGREGKPKASLVLPSGERTMPFELSHTQAVVLHSLLKSHHAVPVQKVYGNESTPKEVRDSWPCEGCE